MGSLSVEYDDLQTQLGFGLSEAAGSPPASQDTVCVFGEPQRMGLANNQG